MTDLSKLVKPLVWTEVEVDRGDGSTDLTGGLEADSPFGAFVIDLGWGSDCYYWSIQSPEGDDLGSNFEDALYAKAAAQADYTARVISALDPEALAQWRDEAVQAEADKLREQLLAAEAKLAVTRPAWKNCAKCRIMGWR